jgi:hypothetical protein
MKTYEIKYEPIILPDGKKKDKWNIYYYDQKGEFELSEFHSYDGINPEPGCDVKPGYTKK